MINVWDRSSDRALLLAVSATLRRVFPSLAVMETGFGSHLLFAFPGQVDIESIRSRLLGVAEPAEVVPLSRRAASAITELRPPPGTPILTDDHAPVEEFIRRSSLTGDP